MQWNIFTRYSSENATDAKRSAKCTIRGRYKQIKQVYEENTPYLLTGTESPSDVKFDTTQGNSEEQTVVLKLDQSFEEFTPEKQDNLLKVIRNLVITSTTADDEKSDIKIDSIRRGSTIVELRLTPEQAGLLWVASRNGALGDFDVLDLKIKDDFKKVEHSPRIFIGHGRSFVWRDLKDFLVDKLNLQYEEFNRESAVGIAISERLSSMLDSCCFAFLVLTAEDLHSDGTIHARENVVHEVGLFQGKYGVRKAIVLLEEGCSEFSTITGLGQIRFPKGQVIAKSEEIRAVLKREGLF